MAYNVGMHVQGTNKTAPIHGTKGAPKTNNAPVHAHGTPITRQFSGARRLNPMGNHK